jgi:hypothetical protein
MLYRCSRNARRAYTRDARKTRMTQANLTTHDLENMDYRLTPWQEVQDLIFSKQMTKKAYRQFFKTRNMSGLTITACLEPEADIADILEMIHNLPKALLQYEKVYANNIIELLMEHRRADVNSFMQTEFQLDIETMTEEMLMQIFGLGYRD